MRKGLFAVMALALMLIVPSAMLLAQEKPAPPKPKMAKEMKLTEEQKATLEAFRLDQRMKAIDSRAELQKQGIMLKKELMKDQPSMTEVEAILKKMSDARTKLQMIRITGMLEMRKMFGPDWKMHMKGCCPGMGPGAMGEESECCEGMEADAPKAMAPFGGCHTERGQMREGRKIIKMRKGEAGRGMQCGMHGMMQKKGAGCGEAPMAMSGERRMVLLKKGGEGSCAKEMNIACMKKGMQSSASCASMAGGWRHKSSYRPRFGEGCCGMESSCGHGGAHKCTDACKKEIKVKVEMEE